MQSLHIIYASTSGHTEYVISVLGEFLKEKGVELSVQKAEEAVGEDLLKGDVLILACATWNLDALEGHLNPHMYALLNKRAQDIDLAGKPVALISLGDDRYFYTCRATERFMQYFMSHNGKPCCPPFLVVNEPYGQEEKVEKWGAKLLEFLSGAKE
jgi:flavodoxin I